MTSIFGIFHILPAYFIGVEASEKTVKHEK